MEKIAVVVPYLNYQWCLHDMLASMGPSDAPILVVDNSAGSTARPVVDQFPSLNVTVETHPDNLGVPASWNRGLDQGAELTVIASQSVRFTPLGPDGSPWGYDHLAGQGLPTLGLDRLLAGVAGRRSDHGLFFGYQQFHLFAVGRALVETVGRFDENIYPGYHEDTDYARRIWLAGIKVPHWHDAGVWSVGWALHKRDIPGATVRTPPGYMADKWGEPEQVDMMWGRVDPKPGAYLHPFNNPELPLSWWPTPSWQRSAQ